MFVKGTLFSIFICFFMELSKLNSIEINIGIVGRFRTDLLNAAKKFNFNLHSGKCKRKCSFRQSIADMIDLYYDYNIKIFFGSLYQLDNAFTVPFVSAANLVHFGLKERICNGKEDLRNFIQLGPEIITSIYSSKGFLVDYLNNQKWCSLVIFYSSKIPTIKCVAKKLSKTLKKDTSNDVRTQLIEDYFQIHHELKYYKSQGIKIYILLLDVIEERILFKKIDVLEMNGDDYVFIGSRIFDEEKKTTYKPKNFKVIIIM